MPPPMRGISRASSLISGWFRVKLRRMPRNGVGYLVTWNLRHIANVAMRVWTERACREAGYEPPLICTPNELMETGHGEDTG